MRRRGLLFLAACAALVVGCGPCREYKTDKVKKWALFKECLAAVPQGPQKTHYNDWDEVLSECEDIASRQASEYVWSKTDHSCLPNGQRF